MVKTEMCAFTNGLVLITIRTPDSRAVDLLYRLLLSSDLSAHSPPRSLLFGGMSLD